MASLHARPASPEAPAAPWRPPGLLRALFWGALAPLLVALVWGCGGSEGGSDGGLDAALDAALDAGPPPDARPAPAPLRQWVDPRIGSGGVGFGYGACSPAAQTPYGMVRPGPNTAMPEGPAAGHHFSGYHADDSLLEGFGQLRSHGMGAVDYGVLAVMPTDAITPERTNKLGYRSAFTQSTEIASPGYYAVTLDDTGIRAEISATDHVGVHRFTFPPGSPQVLLLDASHALTTVQILDASVQIDAAAQEIHGSVLFDGAYSGRRGGMRAYYVARFDRPFQDQGVWDAGALLGAETSRTGTEVGAYVHLDPAGGESVQLAIGISWTDLDHARANLDAEMPIPDLDAARAAAEDEWEGLLSRIEISARTEREFTIFYTALYHSLIMPSLASDVDGSYRGLDRAVHVASGFSYYTDFSLWDTYRTLHPLLTLVYPELQRDFLKSLIAMAGDGGYMPRWPLGYGYSGGMVGESATIVFADSVARGLDGFDLRAAYDAMRATAMAPVPAGASYHGREGLAGFMELGWVPADEESGSVSITMEYAYDDWALAGLADALGEVADRDLFAARAGNWANLYDPSVGFFVGRNRDGSFTELPNPTFFYDFYTEGNAWQYLWFVPHDLPGLAETLGGREALLARLETFFEDSLAERTQPFFPRAYYWHGNEPDIHASWIFSALDQPAGTARWSRWVASRFYSEHPDGLAGNDDSGTLSAWYVFTALGIFPIAGRDDYLIGSPSVTEATLHLAGGDFRIQAPESSEASIYVQTALIDGAPLDRARIPHASLADGGELTLQMGAEPSGWGTTAP